MCLNKSQIRPLVLLLLLLLCGCSGSSDEQPIMVLGDAERQAFIAYVDGKTIPLTVDTEHVANKEEIEAVQFDSASVSVNDGPREQNVTFFLNTGLEKFAVECTVKFRPVEKTVAFFEFEATSVEKQ